MYVFTAWKFTDLCILKQLPSNIRTDYSSHSTPSPPKKKKKLKHLKQSWLPVSWRKKKRDQKAQKVRKNTFLMGQCKTTFKFGGRPLFQATVIVQGNKNKRALRTLMLCVCWPKSPGRWCQRTVPLVALRAKVEKWVRFSTSSTTVFISTVLLPSSLKHRTVELLLKDHPCWETILMTDHPDERLFWWKTTLMKGHPDERPPWWETVPAERLPLTKGHPWWKTTCWETTLIKDYPDERPHPDERPSCWETTLMRPPWWETILLRDHPAERPSWWQTNLVKGLPADRPHWWETILIRDHPDEKPSCWENTPMRDHPAERPTCWETTLLKNNPDERPLSWETIPPSGPHFVKSFQLYCQVNESLTKDNPSLLKPLWFDF